MTRRVVVTGMGVVAPSGGDVPAFDASLRAGRSGVGPITVFDPASLATRIAGEVRIDPTRLGFRDRKLGFALLAAEEAMADAAAGGTSPGGARGGEGAGVSLGIGLELFSMPDLFAMRAPGFALPAERRRRLTFLQTPSDLCLHELSWRFGLEAPPLPHVSACSAGTDAIGTAWRLVATGRRRFMLAGGADSMINPLGVGGFSKLAALSTRNDAPEAASRPFDRGRDGFVLGEGAAVLVLETLDDARARGARTRAEVLGYGSSLDAYAISEPHPEGRGALQAMSRALDAAGLEPAAVDCVNAHGTATPKNDPVETLALRRLLGDRAAEVPVVSTKSMIGHLIAAAGAVEAVAAILGLEGGYVHPTINLTEPDPRCDLDYVPRTARAAAHRVVLSNSFGFGGHNASIVIGRAPRA